MGKSKRGNSNRQFPGAQAMAEIESKGNRGQIRQALSKMRVDPALADEWVEPEMTRIPREYAS